MQALTYHVSIDVGLVVKKHLGGFRKDRPGADMPAKWVRLLLDVYNHADCLVQHKVYHIGAKALLSSINSD